jgi:hypothetical protein
MLRQCVGISTAALIAAMSWLPGRAAALQATPTINPDMPPIELAEAGSTDRIQFLASSTPNLGANCVFGGVSHLMHPQRIGVSYYAAEGGLGSRPVALATLSEPVPYWPTFVCVLDPNHIAVAGKRPPPGTGAGNTVIEVWTLSTPRASAVVEPGPGTLPKSLRGEAVLRKQVVFDESAPGRTLVRGAIKNRGKPTAMFVHFYDSGDLYELDYSQAINPTNPPPADIFPLTKLLSATPNPSVPHFPPLLDVSFRWVSGGTHTTQGYVYTFWVPVDEQYGRVGAGQANLNPIALYDHDLDGVLDEWKQPTLAENEAMGITDPTQFVEKQLVTAW